MQVNAGESGPVGEQDDTKSKSEKAKEIEKTLEAIKGLDSEWARLQKATLSEKLQRRRTDLHAAKPLHAQAHILANRVKQQKVKNDKLSNKVKEAQASVDAARAVLEEAENQYKDAQQTLVEMEAQLGTLQKKLPVPPDPKSEEACLEVLVLSVDKLGELVSKAAEGTEIGQEARQRLSQGISGALREVFVAKQTTIESAGNDGAGQGIPNGPPRPSEAVATGTGSQQDHWKPDDYDIKDLRTELEQSFGAGFATQEEQELRERARKLALGGFNPKRLAQPY